MHLNRRQLMASVLGLAAVALCATGGMSIAADTAPNDVTNVTLAVPGMT